MTLLRSSEVSGHLPGDSSASVPLATDSAHLAGHPGVDVVEAPAPGKLLPKVEEGQHLGGNIPMLMFHFKKTCFKSVELHLNSWFRPRIYRFASKDQILAAHSPADCSLNCSFNCGVKSGCALPCRAENI